MAGLWAADSVSSWKTNRVGCGHGKVVAKVSFIIWTRSSWAGWPVAGGIATYVEARSEGGSIGGVLVSRVVEGDGGSNQATLCWGFVGSKRASDELFGVGGCVVVYGWGWEDGWSGEGLFL